MTEQHIQPCNIEEKFHAIKKMQQNIDAQSFMSGFHKKTGTDVAHDLAFEIVSRREDTASDHVTLILKECLSRNEAEAVDNARREHGRTLCEKCLTPTAPEGHL